MQCRVCNFNQLVLAVDLGLQPWCNNFLKKEEIGAEPRYPLRLVYCRNCATAQLDYTVPKEVMFGDHTYLSGITRSLNEHFRNVAYEVDKRFFKAASKKSVLDIGSNDGTQLKYYKELGYRTVGIESAKTPSAIAEAQGIRTINAFFNLDLAHSLKEKFNVINAAGVFFHLEELHSVTEGIKEALQEDGIFVVQFLYMKSIVENCAFDQIYHEHLLYYTLKTLSALLERHKLFLFDAHLSPIHGGSVIGFVTHAGKNNPSARLTKLLSAECAAKANEFSTYTDFARRIEVMKKKNLEFLKRAKAKGKKIFGFGAPAKGNTLLNFFKIGSDYLDCLVEKNELRRGLYSPGMHIPIILEKELKALPDIYYVLAWNFKDEILENNKNLIDKGVEFYFPVKLRKVNG